MANQAVYGIVKNKEQAEKIIQELLNISIKREDISFLSQHNETLGSVLQGQTGTGETTRNWRTEERLTDYPAGTTAEHHTTTGTSWTENVTGSNSHHTTNATHQTPGGLGHEVHTKAPEGATTGGVTGGIIGGTLGLLAGIGALAIPGLGPFIAAGPLMATLSGIGAGGTLGGIIGALIGSGIPEFEAKRYEDRLKKGGILLSVRANNNTLANQVKEIMQRNGAEDVTISSEAHTSKNS